ncbi:hypothetical protein Lfu02_60660 [Longispora fulva]|uniref:Non-ribosomal peptide synthetase component F n=1 Tax=Longispora fulva TaxID=619741 RepID=A0A8J7GAT7_9ACTN|nr:AMP-binding protein [Longispora fulva]MBG6136953.1 non-ribosomal peptide synthetase component F [Longispora fulva]GIG61694.1 hypothetical protein Lfu02_60660 [Longispora fulva]
MSLRGLFEYRVRATPDAPAVRCGDTAWSYAELADRADRVARHLRGLGLPLGAPVAVCLPRGPHLVAALLGVLQAGGAFALVDPGGPVRRRLRELRPFAVLARGSHHADLPGDHPVVRLDDIDGPPTAPTTATDHSPPRNDGTLDVLVEHGDPAGSRPDRTETYDLADPDPLGTPVTDGRFTVAWVRALCTGGTLNLLTPEAPPGVGADPHRLVAAERITVLGCDPATVRRLLPPGRPDVGVVRLLVVGVEPWASAGQRAARYRPGPRVRVIVSGTDVRL